MFPRMSDFGARHLQHFWRHPALAPDLILFILCYLALPDHFYSLIKYVHEKLAAGEAVLLMD